MFSPKRTSVFGLAQQATLLVGLMLSGSMAHAQGPSAVFRHPPTSLTADSVFRDSTHLTVRPRTMAIAKRTVAAGLHLLDSAPPSYIYVPRRCVGTRRVPLVVLLHWSGGDARTMVTALAQFADSLGVLLLAVQSNDPAGWAFSMNNTARTPDEAHIDRALRQVLAHYAVDPGRLALFGFSAGAGMAADVGYVNGDVFRRVVAFSPPLEPTEFDSLPQHGRPKFFFGDGDAEGTGPALQASAQWLTARGDTATVTEYPGGHVLNEARTAAGFQWLMDGWR